MKKPMLLLFALGNACVAALSLYHYLHSDGLAYLLVLGLCNAFASGFCIMAYIAIGQADV